MSRILFFSRVALICNCCFLLTLMLHYVPFLQNGIVSSTLIILGTVVAIVVNALMNLLYLILTLGGTPVRTLVPLWIVILNFLFLIAQVILLIK